MDIAITFVTTIVQKIAESTIAPVGRQVGYLIQYETNIQNLQSELQKLSDNKVRMQRSIGEEERKGNKRIHDDVKKWLSEVDEISEVVNKFFEDERQPKKCFHGVFPNLMSRYKQSRTATELEKRVVDLIHKKEEFPSISYTTLPRGVLSTKEGYMAFESRALTVNKIIDELTNPDSNKIGVYGLGGVGKTTLVKEVARIAMEKKLFGEVVLVEVKQNPDVNRVQKEIAESLGLETDEDKLSFAGRAKKLYDRIEKDKVLIILDDIWEVLDLVTVGIPVGFCKILMTSRRPEVLKNTMLTDKDFVLEILDDKETWSLFAKMVGDDVLQDPQIEEVARDVAKICGGLPVLIVTVASALRRNKILPSWKDALGKLKKFDKEGYQQKAYSALEWSFNQLGDEGAKNLFLLCGMHGGKAVLLTDLLKYTMGLHVFKDVKTIEETRDRLYSLVDKLKSNCLFMLTGDGANERVEMHDLIREASLLIARKYHDVLSLKYGEELTEWPNKDKLERSTMICLAGRKIPKLPEGLRCTKLQMFLSKLSDDELLEIPYNFFREMKELKVLDLSNFWFRRSSLPSLNFLINLRTLCLHQCVLGDIASVGELSNLEILSLFRSRINQLPKEIGNLARLCMLDISYCTELKVIAPNVLSRLTRLEELNMEDSFKQWEPDRITGGERRNANLYELKHLSELTSLKIHIPNAKDLPTNLFSDKLERYFIIIGDVWDWNVINEKASKVLKLKLDNSNQYLDESLQMVMKRSESLYLDVLEGIYDIPNQLNRQGFPPLKHLQIQNDDNIVYIINSMEWGCSDNTLPILESLFLYKLDRLEGVFCGQLGANSFRQLRSIKVESCPSLKNLFTVSVAGHLSHLENMEVVSCNFLEEIVDHQVANDPVEFLQLKTLTLRNLPNLLGFSSNGSVPINSTSTATKQLFNGKVVFPKLEVLKLSSIPLNNILWDDKVSERLSWIRNLTMLCVDDCDGLRSLCSSSMAINFVQLKWLEISSCQHMVEIILTEEYNNNGEVKNVDGMFPKLETLKLEGLANLENFCTSATYIEFPCLKFLTIQNCTSLGSFTVDPMMSRNVNRSDPAVHYLFDEKVGFPQLEKLIIKGLDKLTTIWHTRLAPDSFCKLIEFRVEYCSSLIHVLVPHILERLHILDVLVVNHCESVQAVFIVNEGRDGEDHHDHPYYSEILTCRNLASVSIYNCSSLKTVFPAPVARVLEKLFWLRITDCKRLEEIVSIDKLEAKIKLMPPKFVFPCAQYVLLEGLPELTSFYPWMHTSMWPSLKALIVHRCHKFEILAQVCSSFQQQQQHVRHDDQLGIPTKQPFFLSEKGSFSRLEEITIELNDSLCGSALPTEFSKIKTLNISWRGITLDFVSVFLKKFHSLQSLTFYACTMEEIFFDDGEVQHVFTHLKSLEMYGLGRLRHVWKENSHLPFGTSSVFPNLENFRVEGCGRLKNIVSSAIPFCNIVRLEVVDCHGLKHLITCSVAKSLVQLQSIIVEDCKRMVEIVASSNDSKNIDEHIDGAARNEITFSRLKLLKLSNLPNLKGFCSRNYNVKFPFLTTLSVISCIEMRISDDGLLLNDSKHEEEEEEEE